MPSFLPYSVDHIDQPSIVWREQHNDVNNWRQGSLKAVLKDGYRKK